MASSVIHSYRYLRKRRALEIVFASRRRYIYQDVPEETYAAMRAASSKGEFFNRHVRDRFSFERNGKIG